MFHDKALVAAGHGGVAQRVDDAGVACIRLVGQGAVWQLVRAYLVVARLGLVVAEHSPRAVVGVDAACGV